MITELKVTKVTPKETAMPYLIEGTYTPSWAENPETNRKHLEFLRTRNPKVVGTKVFFKEDKEILTTTFNGNQVFWIEGRDLIQYYVEVKKFKVTGLLELDAVCQTSVWRNKGYVYLPGVAKWIFTSVLLKKHGNILTDCYQYEDGKRFWAARVFELMTNKRYRIYSLGIHGETNLEVYELNPFDGEIESFEDQYTRDADMGGIYRRLLITTDELQLDVKF